MLPSIRDRILLPIRPLKKKIRKPLNVIGGSGRTRTFDQGIMSRSDRFCAFTNQSLINACHFNPNLSYSQHNLTRRQLRHKKGTANGEGSPSCRIASDVLHKPWSSHASRGHGFEPGSLKEIRLSRYRNRDTRPSSRKGGATRNQWPGHPRSSHNKRSLGTGSILSVGLPNRGY